MGAATASQRRQPLSVAREHGGAYASSSGQRRDGGPAPGVGERLGAGMQGLTDALDTLASVDLAQVDPEELPNLVRSLKQSGDRLSALKTRAIGMMERRGAQKQDGHTTAKQWLAEELHEDAREAAKQTRRARRAEAHPTAFGAFDDGEISEAHVDVIDRAVRQAGPDADRETLEAELTQAARTMPPGELARHARRREIVEQPGRAAERERQQYELRNLRYLEKAGGGAQAIIELTAADYEIHRSAIDALMTTDGADVPPDQRRSHGQRMYDAAIEMARRSLATDPDTRSRNGAPVTGTVIVDLPTLTGDAPGVGELGYAGPITAETARRLLCDAHIARVITAGTSEILDVGRAQRTATPAQARAILAIWKGCARCGAPPSFCEAHHIEWWDRDHGPTDLDNLLPLCWACHTAVHTTGLTITRHPDGTITFTTRTGTNQHRAPP